jgi:adenylate cyclase, class 2
MKKLVSKEVEVKVKVKDFKKILIVLRKLGCKLSLPISQEDKIYLLNSIRLTEINTNTNVLRLRKQNDKNIFTLKRNSVNSLIKIERETVIDNSGQMEEILKYLGYNLVIKVKKQRIKCEYKGMEICLDDIEGLGKYLELEIITSGDPLKEQEKLLSFLKTLNVNMNDRVFYGYDILIYLKDHPEDSNRF